MAHIELGIGDVLAISPPRPVDTESIEGVTEQRRRSGGALVGEALPREGMQVILLAVGMAEALVQRQDRNRVVPSGCVSVSNLRMPHRAGERHTGDQVLDRLRCIEVLGSHRNFDVEVVRRDADGSGARIVLPEPGRPRRRVRAARRRRVVRIRRGTRCNGTEYSHRGIGESVAFEHAIGAIGGHGENAAARIDVLGRDSSAHSGQLWNHDRVVGRIYPRCCTGCQRGVCGNYLLEEFSADIDAALLRRENGQIRSGIQHRIRHLGIDRRCHRCGAHQQSGAECSDHTLFTYRHGVPLPVGVVDEAVGRGHALITDTVPLVKLVM